MYEDHNYPEIKYAGITINSPGHKQVCIELEKREIFFAFEAPIKTPGEDRKRHRRADLIVFLNDKYILVEIDGFANHAAENKRDDDHHRDRLISRYCRVLRFTHIEALERPEVVVDKILDELEFNIDLEKSDYYGSSQKVINAQSDPKSYVFKSAIVEPDPLENTNAIQEVRSDDPMKLQISDFFPDRSIGGQYILYHIGEHYGKDEIDELESEITSRVCMMYKAFEYYLVSHVKTGDCSQKLKFRKENQSFWERSKCCVFDFDRVVETCEISLAHLKKDWLSSREFI